VLAKDAIMPYLMQKFLNLEVEDPVNQIWLVTPRLHMDPFFVGEQLASNFRPLWIVIKSAGRPKWRTMAVESW
jgi:hypothetical protein